MKNLNSSWSVPVSHAEMQRRTGGRTHYNQGRTLARLNRRVEILEILKQTSWPWPRGFQKHLAVRFGVTEGTISLDIASILSSKPLQWTYARRRKCRKENLWKAD